MSNTDIVKRFAQAFFDKDIDTVKELVAENYSFKGPMMEMNSREELIAFIENLPFEVTEINSSYIEQGNQVVKICRDDFTVPPIGTQDMCEVFTFENGKIVKAQLFYDTAPFPKPENQSEQVA